MKKRRLEKISVQLTPLQAVIAYITLLQKAESFGDYTAALFSQVDGPHPIDELYEKLKDSVGSAIPYSTDEQVDRAVKAAFRRMLFLVLLHQHLIGFVGQEESQLGLLSQLAEERLGRMIALPQSSDTSIHDASILNDRCKLLVRTIQDFGIRLNTLKVVVESVEQTHFNATGITLSSYGSLTTELGTRLERTTTFYNGLVVGRHAWAEPAVDLATLQATACERAETICIDLIEMAKVDTLVFMRNKKEARQFLRRFAERAAKGD